LRDLLKRNHDDRVMDYLQKIGDADDEDLMNTKDAGVGALR